MGLGAPDFVLLWLLFIAGLFFAVPWPLIFLLLGFRRYGNGPLVKRLRQSVVEGFVQR